MTIRHASARFRRERLHRIWSRMSPLYIYNESVVGPDFTWLWYCIPKNASRSLLKVLRGVGGIRLRDAGDDERARIASKSPEFSFAFARHPEARVISAWRNKVLRPPPTPGQAKLMQGSPGLRPGMPLNDFVEWLGNAVQREDVDKHWRPQSDYVCSEDGTIVASFVGKIENLEADLMQVRAHVGELDAIPRMNATASHPDEALSAQSRDILRNIYRRDFEILGYE